MLLYLCISVSPNHGILGTGMKKTSQERILIPLLPPRERETNSALYLCLASASILLLLTIHFSFRRNQAFPLLQVAQLCKLESGIPPPI